MGHQVQRKHAVDLHGPAADDRVERSRLAARVERPQQHPDPEEQRELHDHEDTAGDEREPRLGQRPAAQVALTNIWSVPCVAAVKTAPTTTADQKV